MAPANTGEKEIDMKKKIRGTTDSDHLLGGIKADTMFGLEGDDVLEGKGGNDTLNGGAGDDHIYGGNGNDRLYGEIDDDFLFGEAGDDTIRGGDGNDIVVGGLGNDSLFGEAGNDRLFSISGDDKMQGGAGNDYYEIGVGYVTASDMSGNDEYIIIAGATTSIEDVGGTDKIRFKDLDSDTTLTVENLMFKRFGNDLVIAIDDHGGETTITAFFDTDKARRIERIYDENTEASTGYNLSIEALINMESGDSVRGADLWDL
jgi:Ca2+-binding RTX toxin-like protein